MRAAIKKIFSRRQLKKDLPLYLILLPPVLLTFIYKYVPMAGVLIAFKKYLPAKGFFASQWVGFDNFEKLFTMPTFGQALINTIIISFWKIVFIILIPIVVTLMLNELRSLKYKKIIQTLIYLPHFISWVMLASIFMKLMGSSGIVNQFLGALGIEPIIFFGDNKWFPFTLIFTDTWKEFGYESIVYLAAATAINHDLYEAAEMDGAGYWKRMLHVTLPGLMPTVVLMSCLCLGTILNAGFDQVFNMYNPMVYKSGDILDTLVYRMGFNSGQLSLSTAADLFKSAVACVMLITSQKIAYRTTGYRAF